MTELSRGANTPLTGATVDLAVSGARQGAVDLMVFQLGENRKVRSDADFVFFNQPSSPEGAVRLTAADRVTIDLTAVPPQVQTLAVAVSLDDAEGGSLAAVPGLGVQLSAGGQLTSAPALGLTVERAAVLVEVYRRGPEWKARNVSAGWAAGLAALATEHGVVVDAAPAPDPLPPVVPPAPAPPVGGPPPHTGYPAPPVPQPAMSPGTPWSAQPAAAAAGVQPGAPAPFAPGGFAPPGSDLVQPSAPAPFGPGGFPPPGGDLVQPSAPAPFAPGGFPPPGTGVAPAR